MFMVLSSWHNRIKSSPGSFDKCSTPLKDKNLVRSWLLGHEANMQTTLYTVIKACTSNKSHDVSCFNVFKKFFENVKSRIHVVTNFPD